MHCDFLIGTCFYTACTLPARSINIERKGDQPGSSSEKQPKWHTKISHQNPKQNYEQWEMIIVDDGPDPTLNSYISTLQDPASDTSSMMEMKVKTRINLGHSGGKVYVDSSDRF